MTLKDWIESTSYHDMQNLSQHYPHRRLPEVVTYSENDRFCQVFNTHGESARRILPELEDYSLMNVQYWIDFICGSDYDYSARPALFSFQRKQKPARNKATPWKLRSR